MSFAGLRASPYTIHPFAISSRAMLLPPMPLAPTTKAVRFIVYP